MSGAAPALGWLGIFRLGLVQAALGSVVVIISSTLNRIMVVEYALPAIAPGALVALHYAVQFTRPRFGYGSDAGGRRTPWILGGMGVLVCGSLLCALATAWMASDRTAGLSVAVLGYLLVGLGVGAAGTSLLALVALRVDDRRRAAAATIVWSLMILGFAVTSVIVGAFLDPFSPQRLVRVCGLAGAVAFGVATLAVWGVEGSAARVAGSALRAEESALRRSSPHSSGVTRGARSTADQSFGEALRLVWEEPAARTFTLFVFVSMLAYSAQELILEPFAGLVFGFSPGRSTSLSGVMHGGAFLGIVAVGLACSGGRRLGSLRAWTIGGCIASAAALLGMAGADVVGPAWPLRAGAWVLGVANGVFAVAAIGSMMELAHRGRPGRAGTRMGLWGAAQALAFACGGLFGTSIVDLVRHLSGSANLAFGIVFLVEAALFLLAALCASQVDSTRRRGETATTAVSV